MQNLPSPIGFYEFDEELKKFFTINVYPDPSNTAFYETLIPVTGPPVLNLGTQENLSTTNEEFVTRENQIVKLPAIALTQLDWSVDTSRWTKHHYRKLGWTEDGNGVFQSRQPLPISIMYQLDCWTKYRTTMNQIVRTILLKFIDHEVWLPIDFKGVWGKKYVSLAMLHNGPTNLTENEPRDKDRTVRMAFTFNLDAWVIPEATVFPTVKKVVLGGYVNQPGADFPSPTAVLPPNEWDFVFEKIEEDKEDQNP